MIGIQIYSNEGSSPLQRRIITKVQNRVGSFKWVFFSHEPQYHTSSIVFNSWSLGVMRGHNRVKHFYICFNGESL
jgi:hypothetical protein